MKASEFCVRIQELIAVVGDREVVVETWSTGVGSSLFATAAIETQNVKPMAKAGTYRSTMRTNTEVVIKVW